MVRRLIVTGETSGLHAEEAVLKMLVTLSGALWHGTRWWWALASLPLFFFPAEGAFVQGIHCPSLLSLHSWIHDMLCLEGLGLP